MDATRLNLFSGSDRDRPTSPRSTARTNPDATDRQQRELDRLSGNGPARTMKMPLGVMVPLLMRAAENNHAWLEDFAEDTVEIDSDLHQVLMAFQNLPRHAA
jgi:seryl-tRNA synthetase